MTQITTKDQTTYRATMELVRPQAVPNEFHRPRGETRKNSAKWCMIQESRKNH